MSVIPIKGKLRPVTRPVVIEGKTGPQGLKGDVGSVGPQGEQGPKGSPGSPPQHQWEGTRLRFENHDHSWGSWVDLKGEKGKDGTTVGGGGTLSVQYKRITSPTYTISSGNLIYGQNIFGVDTTNNSVTVTLPAKIHEQKIIIIKDEGGNAATNPITIQAV